MDIDNVYDGGSGGAVARTGTTTCVSNHQTCYDCYAHRKYN